MVAGVKKKSGDPEDARVLNRALILRELRENTQLSRADIARRLDISKMTVSAIVNDLIETQLIRESGEGRATEVGGRKPILLTIHPTSRFVLAVDIGTTNTSVALSNLSGHLLVRRRVHTVARHSVTNVVTQVHSLITGVLAEAALPDNALLGIGLSAAGLVRTSDGYIALSPDFEWSDVPIQAILEERTGLPVVVDNCTRAMLRGERWFGGARGMRNLFYVNVGHGIGSAIMVGGRIYDNNSEFGHVYVTRKKVRCDCGKYGCLEAVSSGHAIERRANRESTNGKAQLSAQQVAERANAGDRGAQANFGIAGRYLGRALSHVANLLNPEKIIVGGGVALAGSILMHNLIAEYRRHAMPIIRDSTQLELSELGMDVAVRGAAALALNRFVYQEELVEHAQQ